jgi:ribonuclease Y
MNALAFIILSALAGLGVGAALTGFFLKSKHAKQEEETKDRIKSMLREAELTAETIKKDRMLEAKEKYLKLKAEFDEEHNTKKNLIITNENKVKQLQQQVTKDQENIKRREAELDSKSENLTAQLQSVQVKKVELERVTNQRIADLEKIAALSREEAREELVRMLTEEAQTKASSMMKDILDEAKLTATKQAKKIVLDTIQRTATEHAVENCVSVFNIESDDIKGKIIGREGRNIRALEAATGVEIVVDDTPEAIIISGFDPVRREIARLSLHRLVQDVESTLHVLRR